MTQNKILMINPPHWNLTGINNLQNAGLGLQYLAAMLSGDDVTILDAEALRMDMSTLKAQIDKHKPSHVLVTATTLSFKAMIKTCKLVRQHDSKTRIIIGGPHVTAVPEKSMALTGADCAVVGEAEAVVDEALESDGIIQGEPLSEEHFSEIELDNVRDKMIPALNSGVYAGNDPIYAKPEAVVMWERGCPHNCNFCSTRAVFGQTMRRRNVDSIIKELRWMNENGLKGIFVYDDEVIGVNAEQTAWLSDVCEAIIEEGLSFDFKSQGRCSFEINESVLGLMSSAGFKALMVGCESGSQKVLDAMNKNLKIKEIEYSIPHIASYMDVFTYWMCGSKSETVEDVDKTVDLIRSLKKYIKQRHVTILNPLVGSPIYEEAMANGWIIDHNYNNWTQHGKVILQGPWMNSQQILESEAKLIAC